MALVTTSVAPVTTSKSESEATKAGDPASTVPRHRCFEVLRRLAGLPHAAGHWPGELRDARRSGWRGHLGGEKPPFSSVQLSKWQNWWAKHTSIDADVPPTKTACAFDSPFAPPDRSAKGSPRQLPLLRRGLAKNGRVYGSPVQTMNGDYHRVIRSRLVMVLNSAVTTKASF